MNLRLSIIHSPEATHRYIVTSLGDGRNSEMAILEYQELLSLEWKIVPFHHFMPMKISK